MLAIDRPTRRSARLIALAALAACGSSHDAPASHARAYSLAELGLARYAGGLPVGGEGTLTVDLSVDPTQPVGDWSKVTGTVAFDGRGVTLGDDHAVIHAGRGAFGGDLDFGHVTLDTATARVRVDGGRAHVTATARGDVDADLSLDVTLRARADDAQLAGCIAYKPSDRLLHRDAKTHALFSLLGAPLAPDGRYAIAIRGTAGAPRFLPETCTP